MQEVIVLDTAQAHAATAEILEAHSIPFVVSKDMRDLVPVMPPFTATPAAQPVAQAASVDAA